MKRLRTRRAVAVLAALVVVGTTGQEKLNGPTTIAATYTLNGKTNTFVDTHQMNRPGLLLVNGNIYIGFGSAGCNGGDSGWIMSYNATSLAQNGALDLEPGEAFASIWQKGGGLSADSYGNIYAETGEGPVIDPGIPGQNLGTSVVKVSQVGSTLTVADWFTPYDWSYLYENDLDLHNAVLVLPDRAGPHPHEAVGVGKHLRLGLDLQRKAYQPLGRRLLRLHPQLHHAFTHGRGVVVLGDVAHFEQLSGWLPLRACVGEGRFGHAHLSQAGRLSSSG